MEKQSGVYERVNLHRHIFFPFCFQGGLMDFSVKDTIGAWSHMTCIKYSRKTLQKHWLQIWRGWLEKINDDVSFFFSQKKKKTKQAMLKR